MRFLLVPILVALLLTAAADTVYKNGKESGRVGASSQGVLAFTSSGDTAFRVARTGNVRVTGGGAGRDRSMGRTALSAAPRDGGLAIDFSLGGPETVACELAVHGADGGRIALLESGSKAPGRYRVRWAPARRHRGVFFLRLRARGVYLTRSVFLR